jgi:hypothetical protein
VLENGLATGVVVEISDVLRKHVHSQNQYIASPRAEEGLDGPGFIVGRGVNTDTFDRSGIDNTDQAT